MAKSFFKLVFTLSLVFSFGLGSQESKGFLSTQDVYQSIETMLEYHVEYKEFSSLLAKRSFKIFIDQFDPYKMYLLASEGKVFLRMSEEKLEKVVQGHRSQSYEGYQVLNDIMQQSIKRAREIRKALRPVLLEEDLFLSEISSESFPQTLDSLKEKIHQKLLSFLISEKNLEGVENFSMQERERLLNLWEEKMCRMEDPYLESPFSSSSFSMHILKAFAKSLDAHSSFFSAEEAYDLKTTLEKQFEGIGIVLREGVQGVVVKSLIKNGPAEKSGQIRKGDLLISIDGHLVSSLPYVEVLSRLKGERGQKVSLELSRCQASRNEVIQVDIL